MVLLASTLCFSGNIYSASSAGNPDTDISQQNAKVTGTVEDALGPVAGASVVIKGTTNGTMTDMDGNFTLDGVKKWGYYPNILYRLRHTGDSLCRTSLFVCTS